MRHRGLKGVLLKQLDLEEEWIEKLYKLWIMHIDSSRMQEKTEWSQNASALKLKEPFWRLTLNIN